MSDLHFDIEDVHTQNATILGGLANFDVEPRANFRVSSEAFHATDSSKALFFNPIPDDMIEVRKASPGVVASVNGVTASI